LVVGVVVVPEMAEVAVVAVLELALDWLLPLGLITR